MPGETVHLLLVEDNPDQAELTRTVFEKQAPSVRITTVANGQAALDALAGSPFNAMILDYSLPRMNGLEVLDRIQERRYTVPVIMVTGQGDETVAVEAMKKGAYDYILKTKNYQEILPRLVQKVVEKRQLKNRLDEATLRARRLYEVSLAVTKERKIDVLVQSLVEGVRQLLQTEGALLLLIDPERNEIRSAIASGIELDRCSFPCPAASLGLWTLARTERRPVMIETPEQHPLWKATPALRPSMRNLLAVPMVRQGIVEGILAAVNTQGASAFSPEDMDPLSTLAVHAAVAIDNARFLQDVERQAITDGLTGLYNHREFQRRLGEEVERGKRYGKDFSMLMLDIDHFKSFNDTYGHPMGDAVLKEIAKVIQQSIRNVDIASRYGGEEFTVILPETTGQRAKIVAERIRGSIDEERFAGASGHPARLSVSIGMASFPADADSRERLITVADEALYFAKEGGRNKVCSYSDTLKSAIEKDQRKLTDMLNNPKMKTFWDLATAIDGKSPYTRGHTEAVVQFAMHLAEALNLGENDKKSLQLASLLHNIGMVSVPDTLLNKPGPLSLEEKKIVQAHPALAEMLAKESTQLDGVLPAILYHHERYDGHGYPNGLRGEEIPFLARVLGVVEAYQAMISVRPYRPRLTVEAAAEELRQNAGRQFDPRIVETFLRILKPSG
ncbi:MAG TPA: diguanylate cyclase [Nitrospiria bacterium]|nr:diguanylate cyclase [Nitrospiria bacterium]